MLRFLLPATLLFTLPALSEPQPLRIGLMAALSGESAENGKQCRFGYQLAQTLAPTQKRKIQFLFADHRTEPRTGITEFRRLVEAQDSIAVVTTRSQIAMPLNPISLRNQVPLLATVGHVDFVTENSYGFRFWPAASLEAKTLARYTLEKGFARLSIVNLEDEWTLSLAESFKAELSGSAARVVEEMNITLDESDFSAHVSRIKKSDPDVILVNLAIAQTELLIRKIREHGLDQPIIANFWAQNDSVIQSAGIAAMEGIVFAEIDTNKPLFRKQLRERFDFHSPTSVTYVCYTALTALLQALAEIEGIPKREMVHEKLSSMREVKLLDEEIPMLNREAQFSLHLKRIEGGKVRSLPE